MFEYILYVKIKVVTIGIYIYIRDDCKDCMLRNLLYDLYVVSRFLTNKVQKWHTLWQVFYAFVSSEFVGSGWHATGNAISWLLELFNYRSSKY